MIFKPVWVSTVDHLNQFKTITANTSAAIKRGGRYDVPEDFPQTRMAIFFGLAYSSPSPLVMFSNGALDLNENGLYYKAFPLRLPGNKISNVKDELEFSISVNEVTFLEHYLFVSPINKNFNVSFSRVHSTKEGFLQDFLVCVGGQGLAFEKMRRASADLYAALTKIMGK